MTEATFPLKPHPDPLAAALPATAARMEALALELGSTAALREVKHLEPCAVAALQDVLPEREVAKNRRLAIPSWSPVGNVDLLAFPAEPAAEPLIAAELKWCHVDKLYEAIWDLFKMALLSTTGAQTYLVTGATRQMWANSVGAELFGNGMHAPAALCEVRLPWGRKLRAWDDLLWGGYDKYPLTVPSEIRTTLVAREPVGRDGEWELRAVAVSAGAELTPFEGGWPFARPHDAVRPLLPNDH